MGNVQSRSAFSVIKSTLALPKALEKAIEPESIVW